MNTAFGEPKDKIPFDLAHKRWPIIYNLSGDNCSKKSQIKSDLIAVLVEAIKSFAKQRKVTKPFFKNNAEKIKHQEEFRKQLGDYIQEINKNKLRRRVIIRDVDRVASYPEVTEEKGISPWFKVGLAQLSHRGVQVFLNVGDITLCDDGTYRFRDHSKGEKGDERVFLIGEIPFSNIVIVNINGDEYDYFPHIFCHFSEPTGEPYERLIVCKKIEMGHGHEYYSEVEMFENMQKNSEKYGVKYFT